MASPPPPPPLTRGQKQRQSKNAFTHVMKTILEFEDDSPMMLVMKEMGFSMTEDLAGMSIEQIMGLTYQPNSIKAEDGTMTVPARADVPFCDRIKLRNLIWWRNQLAMQRLDDLVVSHEDWQQLTEEAFDTFVAVGVPKIVHGHDDSSNTSVAGSERSVTVMPPPPTTTDTALDAFSKGYKRSLDNWTTWNGNPTTWYATKRHWLATAQADGVDVLMTEDFTVPTDGTTDRKLFDEMNKWIYIVMLRKVTAGQALVIVQQHDTDKDGRRIYLQIVAFYEKQEFIDATLGAVELELANLRLHENYSGGAAAFFIRFQHLIKEYEQSSGRVLGSNEKIKKLEIALQNDHRFLQVKMHRLLTISSGGTPMDYDTYLTALMHLAQQYKPTDTKRRGLHRSDARTRRNQEGQDDNDDDDADDDGKWRTDDTARVPNSEFRKMTKEEKTRRFRAREEAKKNGQRQVNAAAVTSPTNDAASEEPVQPSVQGIFASRQAATQAIQATTLPPGLYTDAQGNTYRLT